MGWVDTGLKTLMAFFGWRQSSSDRKTIIDEKARDVADMANALKVKAKSAMKAAAFDKKRSRHQWQLEKREDRRENKRKRKERRDKKKNP